MGHLKAPIAHFSISVNNSVSDPFTIALYGRDHDHELHRIQGLLFQPGKHYIKIMLI